MEQNNHKFRLRLNLFDAIILVVVLAVGAAVAWFGLRSGGGDGLHLPDGAVHHNVSKYD